jgi:hypothetical protein
MTAMADPNAKAQHVAQELGITTTTRYASMNGDGTPKKAAQVVLNTRVEDT